MMRRHPRLGAQIFKIYPGWGRTHRRHCRNKHHRQFAGKGFDDEFGGIGRDSRVTPRDNLNAIYVLSRLIGVDYRHQRLHAFKVIDYQSDTRRVFQRNLARQTPRDADVAKVIDDAAKNIAGER